MKSILLPATLFSLAAFEIALGIGAPTGLVIQAGDRSIVLHWERNPEPNVGTYRIYRSMTNGGQFTLLSATAATAPGYCDLNVTNGQTNFYYVTAVTGGSVESAPSLTNAATPHPFANDDEFLEYVQQTCFDYFWYAANPTNGMVPDRSAKGSPASIAAVGFGLTAIGIAIDHGWIARTQGITRVLATLNTFLSLPQGSNTANVIGYKGWFYHFLDMNTGMRYTPFNTELSSIDTALLLGGVLYAKQYFSGTNTDETAIRAMADAIFNRIDWNWMARGTDLVSMGWYPDNGFINRNWAGYNEGMIIYCLGLGTATNPLPETAWSHWSQSYSWTTNYGQAYVPFASLFVHQYSHCWIDFRHIADSYMTAHDSTYFENSRRASLANLGYCTNNPQHHAGYSSLVWGLTACDGPNGIFGGVTYQGYAARGAPNGFDDGTLAPTAAGGSIAFTPQYSIPTLRYIYTNYLRNIWTAYGYRDSFNLDIPWWDTDELGIDQGPIVIMIENYRTQKVWKLFMKNPEVQNGLRRAGFKSVFAIPTNIQALVAQNSCTLNWRATTGRIYQVEFSPDLESWFSPPSGEVTATNDSIAWVDAGPPETASPPLNSAQRFYRVFQYGAP